MNLRHAAALALVGWYLMVAPLQSRENWDSLVPNPPFGRWFTRDAFDSADACGKARTELTTRMDNATEEDYHRWLAGRPSSDELLREWSGQYSPMSAIRLSNHQAQCVATDDPRLKEK
jgi:hypothetical protein